VHSGLITAEHIMIYSMYLLILNGSYYTSALSWSG